MTLSLSALSSKVSTGIKAKQVKSVRRAPVAAVASLDMRKAACGAAAAVLALNMSAMPAKADLTADLLARTEANKELNDKKRAATSSANFARSRTVTDGSCHFPENMLGCENYAETSGKVKFLSDDIAVECEGTREGKVCSSKAPGSLPSPFGL